MGYVLRRVALKLYNYYAKVFAVNYLSTTLEGAYLSYVLTEVFYQWMLCSLVFPFCFVIIKDSIIF